MSEMAPTPLADNDDWFTAEMNRLIDDPALIETHEKAAEVLDLLDHEIAAIQTQIDAATIEANIRPLSADRQHWLRRASYACAMRRNSRHRVMQRDKEIRGTKGPAQTARKDPAVGLAKQARLHAEADARKAVASAKHQEMVLLKTVNHQFVIAARRALEPEVFAAIMADAKKMATLLNTPSETAMEMNRRTTSEWLQAKATELTANSPSNP